MSALGVDPAFDLDPLACAQQRRGIGAQAVQVAVADGPAHLQQGGRMQAELLQPKLRLRADLQRCNTAFTGL